VTCFVNNIAVAQIMFKNYLTLYVCLFVVKDGYAY